MNYRVGNWNKFLIWPPRPRIFRIACGYLLHSLIFHHSLCTFKDFGTQITDPAVFTKIFFFQKWVLFPIWMQESCQRLRQLLEAAAAPDRKTYSLLRDKYFCEDSRICYLRLKSFNMRSEWGNIKECNKYPRTILNIRGRVGQLMMNP